MIMTKMIKSPRRVKRVNKNSIVVARHELGYREVFSSNSLLFQFFMGKKEGERVTISRGGYTLPSDSSVWVIEKIVN